VYFPETVKGDSMTFQLKGTMAVVARASGDVATTTRAMQRIIHEMDPTLPTFGVRSMRATVESSMALLSFTMIVLGVAAAVTLVLGMIGLYGVIAYVVSLRTSDLGVRMTVDAQPASVGGMVRSWRSRGGPWGWSGRAARGGGGQGKGGAGWRAAPV
jgi:hypothetical protein